MFSMFVSWGLERGIGRHMGDGLRRLLVQLMCREMILLPYKNVYVLKACVTVRSYSMSRPKSKLYDISICIELLTFYVVFSKSQIFW